MGRYIFQNHFTDRSGNVIESGNATVYDANSTNLATIYSSSGASTAKTGSVLTTGADGFFRFWVDNKDYNTNNKFKIILSKTNFTSKTYDDIVIFPETEWIYYADSGATDQATDNSDNSLKDLINEIGAVNNRAIICKPATYNFSGSSTKLTITSNISLKLQSGAVLSDGGNKVDLVINGSFDPESKFVKYFNWTGSGTVTFGDGAIKEIYPQWFGAKGDNATNDTTAITQAGNSLPTGKGGIIFFPRGTYLVNQWRPARSGISIIGEDADDTILKGQAAGNYVLSIYNISRGSVKNLKIDGNNLKVVCLEIDSVGGTSVGNYRFENLYLQGATTTTINIAPTGNTVDASYIVFERVQCASNNAALTEQLKCQSSNAQSINMITCSLGGGPAASYNMNLVAGQITMIDCAFSAVATQTHIYANNGRVILIGGKAEGGERFLSTVVGGGVADYSGAIIIDRFVMDTNSSVIDTITHSSKNPLIIRNTYSDGNITINSSAIALVTGISFSSTAKNISGSGFISGFVDFKTFKQDVNYENVVKSMYFMRTPVGVSPASDFALRIQKNKNSSKGAFAICPRHITSTGSSSFDLAIDYFDKSSSAWARGGYIKRSSGLFRWEKLFAIPHRTDPVTAAWGTTHAGISWLSSSANRFKFWDGSAVKKIVSC